MNLLSQLLPKVERNYKSVAFDVEENIRPIFLKYGIYADIIQLEEALATVYAIADKLGNSLIEDDIKVVVLEKENSVIPINGIAVAALLSVPTLSIGDGLMLPKLNDDYYNEVLKLLTILPLDGIKTYVPFDNQVLVIVAYDMAMCRSSWFRYSNKEKRYLIYIGDSQGENTMGPVSCTEKSYCFDKQFSDKKDRIIRYWYEDTSLDDYCPGGD